MIAQLAGVPIYDVNLYNQAEDSIKTKIDVAIRKVDKWIKHDNCLCVKDRDIGSSGDACYSWVMAMKEKFIDRDLVLIIDNFSNMSGSQKDAFQTEAYNINILHDLRVRHEVAIISSFETNKEGSEGRFTNKGQKGGIDKMFRLTLSFNVYNELGEAQSAGRTTAKDFWVDHIGRKMPIIESTVSKNKLNCKTGFKGKLFWKFVPYVGHLELIGDESKFEKFKLENHAGKHREIISDLNSVTTSPPIAQPVKPQIESNVNLPVITEQGGVDLGCI